MSASIFQEAKIWLILTLDLSRDALHVYIGLTVFLGVALVFRLRLADWRPWFAVLLAALAGEAWDWIDDARFGHGHIYYGHVHDFVNTLFWPTMLLLLARYTKLLKR